MLVSTVQSPKYSDFKSGKIDQTDIPRCAISMSVDIENLTANFSKLQN